MTSRPISDQDLEILTGTAHPMLATEIAEHLGLALGPMTISRFPDSETYVRVETSVRGKDVYVIQPTCPPVNENLMELMVILDALRRASTGRITAVIPYFGYARQDKKITGREPISARMVADMLTTGGADRVLTIDLHSLQIQGFFDIPVDQLTAVGLLTEHMRKWDLSDSVIVAPDAGRVNMATDYAGRLGLPVVIVHKRRTGPERTQAAFVVGDVKGKRPIIIDDMITTGGTIGRSVTALMEQGAQPDVRIVATHPVLVGSYAENLRTSSITEILVTNTIPVPAEKQFGKVRPVSVARMLADAISCIHRESSVSALFA